MQRIVVGFNTNSGGMLALERGIELALRFGAELIVAHVSTTTLDKPAIEQRIEIAIDTLLPPYRSPRRRLLVWRTAFGSGDIASALCTIAANADADLLVLGSQRTEVRLAAALRAGVLTKTISGLSSVPILIERKGGGEALNRVLAVTSLDSCGERIVLEAARLAQEFMSDLFVLYVLPTDLGLIESALPLPAVRRAFEEYRLRAEQGFHEFLQALKPSLRGYPYTPVFATGNPVDEVLRLVKNLKLDLIVVGANRKRRLSEALFGSSAEQLALASPSSVLVVPVSTEAPERIAETELVGC